LVPVIHRKNGEVLVPRIVRCIFIDLFYFLNNFNHQVKTENFKIADRQESKTRAPGGRSVFRANARKTDRLERVLCSLGDQQI